MFTGIITAVGRLKHVHKLGSSLTHGKRLTIKCPDAYLDDVGLGDSIALNGACMTVTTLDPEQSQFTVDISAESLARTTGLDQPGPINLEKPCVPMTGWAATWCRAMSMASATSRISPRSAKAGTCRSSRPRNWQSTWLTKVRSPSTA
jgi:hypothetical protein